MSCAYPMKAWRSPLYKSNKPGGLWFNCPDHLPPGSFTEVSIPCGQCMLCRLDYSKKWAIRLEHEAHFHTHSCFLTLTYDDEHVPIRNGLPSLNYDDVTKFIKKLRITIERKSKQVGCKVPDIRYFYCGEYGPSTKRPHYHLIIYGYFPLDAKRFSVRGGNEMFLSKEIAKLWTRKNSKTKKMEPLGYHLVAFNNWDTFRYVAGYVTKKYKAPKKDKELYYNGRAEEKLIMSRRPAIGRRWIEKYHEDVYPLDHVITSKGHSVRPPRYYDEVFFGEINHDMERCIKERRKAYLLDHPVDNHRLQCKERIAQSKCRETRGKI